MTTEQTIPLNQLFHSKAIVRQTGKTEGIGELAASIAVHGLRKNLNVLPTEDERWFEVVAGCRRLRAMKHLVRRGSWPGRNQPRRNAMRTVMHPDGQVEAFRA